MNNNTEVSNMGELTVQDEQWIEEQLEKDAQLAYEIWLALGILTF